MTSYLGCMQVGLLDIDICGPSVPRMLGLEGQEIHSSAAGWSPVFVDENLGVMSIGFLLPDQDDAVIWRGPRKNGLIKQFLKVRQPAFGVHVVSLLDACALVFGLLTGMQRIKPCAADSFVGIQDVDWGELDYLVVDAPPGTSDEHISIAQYLKDSQVDGAVIVTTPQEIALLDVRKEINFAKKVGRSTKPRLVGMHLQQLTHARWLSCISVSILHAKSCQSMSYSAAAAA